MAPGQTAPDRNRPLGYFKSMGASAWGLDAKERLEVMHSISTRRRTVLL